MSKMTLMTEGDLCSCAQAFHRIARDGLPRPFPSTNFVQVERFRSEWANHKGGGCYLAGEFITITYGMHAFARTDAR